MTRQRSYYRPEGIPPHGVFLRTEAVSADTEYLPHRHEWGQLLYVVSGVVVLRLAQERFWAPTHFAIWLPQGVEHACYNQRQATIRTINFDARWYAELPETPCLLEVGPLFKAIQDDLFARDVLIPHDKPDLRLCHVLCDQMTVAPRQRNYLPGTDDRLLAPVLHALEQCPADDRTLAQWAAEVYSTERTLSRRCQALLGMSFSEWRQRLRYLQALALLRQGMSVQSVALEVGYSSSSAFIAMFRQQSGATPEGYRARP
ncbi:helix-turn-helix domain-containing protein [Candidatus Symbiopectobacterium sp. NZEC151]|uniref:AraC family transcriptional regulator n=1 Tax=Candidatus Symbiopectobacterium sp. NZEC151 TaxID=2820470 RepID=UPI00222662A5|nr:helix-turn-helix transcriptional regulator [Candidatus Symbiopectobacterium sp. NZEC151]MCW2475868.1 helix-turn-helix transcriptional regulator [Candidatus Symbiopectobacterium sp. NZEC151]